MVSRVDVYVTWEVETLSSVCQCEPWSHTRGAGGRWSSPCGPITLVLLSSISSEMSSRWNIQFMKLQQTLSLWSGVSG